MGFIPFSINSIKTVPKLFLAQFSEEMSYEKEFLLTLCQLLMGVSYIMFFTVD